MEKLLEKLIEAIGEDVFSITPYEEDGEVCGFDLETWTPQGVDMLPFVDLRGKELCAEEFVNEVKSLARDFDVDDAIDIHREDPGYRSAFTYRQAVHDFEEYADMLRDYAKLVSDTYDTLVVIKD